MLSLRSSRPWLAVLPLLAFALPAGAAPAPKGGAPNKFDKYFLDDTDFLLTVNVKEIVKSPMFAKHYKKKLEGWLAEPASRSLTKDLGINPLKDVDSATMLLGRSCFTEAGPNQDGPVFILQGRFDSAKIIAGLNKLDKARPGAVSKEPGGPIYQLHNFISGTGMFLAPLDAHTVILAPRKQHVLDALAKAAGKKTTRFAAKEVPARIKRLRPDVAVQAFGLGSMVLNSGMTSVNENGQKVVKRKHSTLLDSGGREVEVSVTVKDDVQARFVLTAKDKAQHKALTDSFRSVLDLMKATIQGQVNGQPKLAPLARLVEGITLKSADEAVILEGKATAEMIQAFIELSGLARMVR